MSFRPSIFVIEQRILKYLADRGEEATLAEIKQNVKGRNRTIIEVLKDLVESSDVNRQGFGIRDAPFRFTLSKPISRRPRSREPFRQLLKEDTVEVFI